MPRHDFHLSSQDRLIWDREGVDLPDPAPVQDVAGKGAAELYGGLLHESKACCCWTVAVANEGDKLVHVTSL
jgi:hypothetical protein